MNKEKIVELLADYLPEQAESFAAYCIKLKMATDRGGNCKNIWVQRRTSEQMATLFKRVAKDGLVFDGVHITLQSTGIMYDYIAYKNKMFLAYPESTVDVSLVREGDEFNFQKDSGVVTYTHNIAEPFKKNEIIGGYCVIKNKRGEFITILSREDIDKHRKVARTDFIWKQWFEEMATKTIIKKACKLHFSDIFQNIEKIDNENYNLKNPLDLDLKLKQEIDAIKTEEELLKYYKKNKGQGKDFDKYISIKKAQLNENSQDEAGK